MAYIAEKLLSEKRGMKVLELNKYPHVIESDLFRIKRFLPACSVGGPWIAGGSVWRTVNNEPLEKCDIDMFFRNKDQYEQMCRQMNSIPFVRNILKETKNKWNTTYKIHVNQGKYDKTIDVQLVNMSFHSKLENLLDSFDFTVCQFGYNGENIIMNETSLEDLEKRRLVIWKLRYPKTMLKHMLRYMDNGFTISSDETKRLTSKMLESDCWAKSAGQDYNEKAEKNACAEVPFDPFDDGVIEDEPDVGGGHNPWRARVVTNVPFTAYTNTTANWTAPATTPAAALTPRQQATQDAREIFARHFGGIATPTPRTPTPPAENPFAQPEPTPTAPNNVMDNQGQVAVVPPVNTPIVNTTQNGAWARAMANAATAWEGYGYGIITQQQGNDERR